jgi:hypothetical protein
MKASALALTVLLSLQSSAPDALLAKLDAYLTGYEAKLSELIADEQMSQEVRYPVAGPRRGDPGVGFFVQRLGSEVAFIALPGDAGWLGFRHVKTVDGRPVDEVSSLTTALSGTNLDPARALLEASAAHNLGLRRNTNLPNLPLEFLHRRNRRRLVAHLDGSERVRGVNTIRVVFKERARPTLVKHPNGSDQPSVARAWIDPRNGRLLRAEVITFSDAAMKRSEHSIRVEFDQDRQLGLLVPREMREKFPDDRGGAGKGTAAYSNYRRFTTSARIVPQ